MTNLRPDRKVSISLGKTNEADYKLQRNDRQVLNKDTSLAEKIRMLFREQGNTIASILTAIEMAVGVLVEALLPGGGGSGAEGKPSPKDYKV